MLGLSSVRSQSLYALNIDPDTIVVSGYSCGSWISHQLGTIFSGTIKGQILACGGMAFDGYEDVDGAIEIVDDYSTDGDIDSTDNLDGYPVYIWSGEEDTVIPPANQEEQEEFYDNYDASVEFVSSSENGHDYNDDTWKNGLDYVYGVLDSSIGDLSDWEDDDEW